MKNSVIFFDVETIPDGLEFDVPKMPTIKDMRVGNITDPVKKKKAAERKLTIAIEKYQSTLSDLKEKAVKAFSLNPLKNKIICLSYAINHNQVSTFHGSEKHIMTKLNDLLAKTKGQFILVAYNGKEFDFNLLAFRSILYNLAFLKNLFYRLNRNDVRFLDLADVFRFFSYKSYHKLDDICKFFGIDSPKASMKGSDVYSYYKQDRIEEICRYCENDVEAIRKLYYMLYG